MGKTANQYGFNLYRDFVIRNTVMFPCGITSNNRFDAAYTLSERSFKRLYAVRQLYSVQHEAMAKRWQRSCFCRPLYAIKTDTRQPCGLANFCPNCWARRAAQHWEILDKSLFSNKAAGNTSLLLVGHRTVTIPVDSSSHLAFVLAYRTTCDKGRRQTFAKSKAAGMHDLTTCWLNADGKGSVVAKQIFAFSLWAAKHKPPVADIVDLKRVTRKELVKLVSQAHKLPHQLRDMQPPAVLEYFGATKSRRLVGNFGIFRSTSSSEPL